MAGKIKLKPRREGARGKSGRLLDRGRKEDTIPPFALLRRAEALGLSVDDIELRGRGAVKDGAMHIDKVDGSSNLGILHARGIIGLHHKDAGLKLWSAYQRWKLAIEARSRFASTFGFAGHAAEERSAIQMDEDACIGATEAYRDILTKCRFARIDPKTNGLITVGLNWKLIEAAVIEPGFIDDIAPRLSEKSQVGDDLRKRLVSCFDALCAYFNITVDG